MKRQISHRPLLTIGIPTYNRGHLLQKQLKILKRELCDIDYDQVEIIIADNCSTDKTKILFREVDFGLHKCAYICHKKNLGFDKNILFLYMKAKGKYVWFLSDDDHFKKNTVRDLLFFLKRSDASFVIIPQIGNRKELLKEKKADIIPINPVGIKKSFSVGFDRFIDPEDERLRACLLQQAGQISTCIVKKKELVHVPNSAGGLMHSYLANMALLRNNTYLIIPKLLIIPGIKDSLSKWSMESTLFGVSQLYSKKEMKFSRDLVRLISEQYTVFGLSVLKKALLTKKMRCEYRFNLKNYINVQKNMGLNFFNIKELANEVLTLDQGKSYLSLVNKKTTGKNKKLLTICIPTFNRATLLKTTLINLSSILKSIPNWREQIQVMISDNDSIDGTNFVAQHFPDFMYFRQTKNVGYDRNVLFLYENSNSQYIFFLSDDDLLVKDGFLKAFKKVRSLKFDLILCNYGNQRKKIGDAFNRFIHLPTTCKVSHLSEYLPFYFISGFILKKKELGQSILIGTSAIQMDIALSVLNPNSNTYITKNLVVQFNDKPNLKISKPMDLAWKIDYGFAIVKRKYRHKYNYHSHLPLFSLVYVFLKDWKENYYSFSMLITFMVFLLQSMFFKQYTEYQG